MKLILLSLRIFKKNKFLSLLLCLEMIIGLCFNIITLNSIVHNNKEINIIKNAGLKQSLFFMGSLSFDNNLHSSNIAQRDDLVEYLNGKKEYVGRSTHTILKIEKNNEEKFISSFDDITSQRLAIDDIEGQWYTEVSLQNNNIPCVIMNTYDKKSNYTIGDVIDGKLTSYFNSSNGEEYSLEYSDEYKFQVVGIVDRTNAFSLTYSNSVIAGEVIPSLNLMFSKVAPNTETILCGKIPDVKINDEMYGILYLKENTSNIEVDNIYKKICEYGSCYKISDMLQKSEENIKESMKVIFPQYFVIFIILTSGLISMTLLNGKKYLSNAQIYILCGANWRTCKFIYFLYFLLLFMISLSTSLLVLQYNYLYDNRGLYYLYYIAPLTILKSFLCISCISFFATIAIFYKKR